MQFNCIVFLNSMQKESLSGNRENGQYIQKTQQAKNKTQQFGMEEIVSQRGTQQIEDDLTALRNKNNQTPLAFYCKIGESYLISFRKSELLSFNIKIIILALFLIGILVFVFKYSQVPQQIKMILTTLTMVDILAFILLFYLDPGTLFDDEQEKIDEERLYCQTCRVYRSHNSHHCPFCVKCVKGYDHHCGFFSKCIGKRNYFIFCLFIISCGITSFGSIGSLVYTVMAAVGHKNE